MEGIVGAVFTSTKHILGMYATKQARKYLERVIKLEKAYYREEQKDESQRNHGLMDNVIYELCLISQASTTFGTPSIKN